MDNFLLAGNEDICVSRVEKEKLPDLQWPGPWRWKVDGSLGSAELDRAGASRQRAPGPPGRVYKLVITAISYEF